MLIDLHLHLRVILTLLNFSDQDGPVLERRSHEACVFSKDISKIHRRTELVGSRPAPFLPLLKQDFGSGWILEGPAYVGPGTLVVVPGLFILS